MSVGSSDCVRSLMLASLLVVCAGAEASGQTHCSAEEATVFSCHTANGKLLSVCGSRALSAGTGYVQYRFGKAGSPELLIPERTSTRAAGEIGAGTMSYSGGGGAFLRFRRGTHAYVVYTAIGRGWGSRAGVVVERQGRAVAEVRCAGEAVSEIGPDLFTRAGLPDDADGFELP
ncbi:MAG: hypothetical protein U1E83_05905 [Methylotetracoccus sp.]